MFKRRIPLPFHKRAGAILWPRGGWRRSSAYVAHRLRRLPGTPYRIAAGFASGAAISFTPFIGFHFLLAAALAVLVRGNLLAAAVGTVVGNPWTFPFIWLWTYSLGNWVLGVRDPTRLPRGFSFHDIFSFQHVVENPLDVLLPMMIGGMPTAVVAWIVFFWPLKRTVAEYQKARQRRFNKRLHKHLARAEGRVRKGRENAILAEKRKFERRR